MRTKTKGSVGELSVAAKLLEEGWRVLFPFGEETRYDLVAERDGRFLRIQVKYVTPKDGRLEINCRSSNNWSAKSYTTDEIDAIAAYDAASRNVYFIPAAELNSALFTIRIGEPRNAQREGIRFGSDYFTLKMTSSS